MKPRIALTEQERKYLNDHGYDPATARLVLIEVVEVLEKEATKAGTHGIADFWFAARNLVLDELGDYSGLNSTP